MNRYPQRAHRRFGFAVLVMLAGCGDPTPAPVAELIVTNAKVYTFSWADPSGDGHLAASAPHDPSGWHPDAGALAIKNGVITFVGTAADVEAWRGPDTTVLDVGGATVLPGLVDSHTHIFGLGAAMSRVDLNNVTTEEEAVARITARAKTVPKGDWIVGQGWDEGAWANRYPDKTLLTAQVPDHPVYMRSLHSFAGWGNQMALDRAGITRDTLAPTGGEIEHLANGEPSGLLLNRAVPLLEAAVPAASDAQLRDQVLTALEQMAADGYVTIHDAGLNAREMAVLEALETSGELPIRVYAMLSIRDEALVHKWLARGPDEDSHSYLVTRSIKGFYDGALGSRGARLLADYSDQPGHRGVSGDQYGFNESLAGELIEAGFQLGIHAIGDAGNRETLDFFAQAASQQPGSRSLRHRIEHAQVLHPADVPRFAELGIIASMEPAHAVEDKTWAEQRLGPQRMQGAYAWRTLRQQGARITFNADNPGSSHDIFYGLHAAITRRDSTRKPAGGWYPEQALTAEEAIRGYTRWSAYAAFREEYTGELVAGKWADITVMDIDPLQLAETDPGSILDGAIIATIVAGKVVYPN
jgi:predicted amidohydrolase YtcJ